MLHAEHSVKARALLEFSLRRQACGRYSRILLACSTYGTVVAFCCWPNAALSLPCLERHMTAFNAIAQTPAEQDLASVNRLPRRCRELDRVDVQQSHSVSRSEGMWEALRIHEVLPKGAECRALRSCLQVGERFQRATVRLQASRATVSLRVKDLGERSEALRPQSVS